MGQFSKKPSKKGRTYPLVIDCLEYKTGKDEYVKYWQKAAADAAALAKGADEIALKIAAGGVSEEEISKASAFISDVLNKAADTLAHNPEAFYHSFSKEIVGELSQSIAHVRQFLNSLRPDEIVDQA